MSSFFVSIFVLVAIGVVSWRCLFRFAHIGYGVVLAYKEDDGTVWVASRLFNTPAHRHGILNHSQVLFVGKKEMIFPNGEAFLRWFKERNLTVGQKERWVVRQEGKELVADLIAERIFKEIPVYWNPNEKPVKDITRGGMVKPGTEYCHKTGQHYPTGKLSAQALKQVFFSY